MMLIEPKWFKKNKYQIFKKSINFFLTDFGLYNNAKAFCKSEVSVNRVEIVPTSSLANRIFKESDMINCNEKQYGFVVNPTFVQQGCPPLSTCSFSSNTPENPLVWKTISVHPFKKNDWSIRSEKNTGFYSTEILQTTTI